MAAGQLEENWKQAQPEFFQLSDVGFVKGEILALLTCTCMQVGKSHPLNITEISSLIETGCSCSRQEVRAFRPLHKPNSVANSCTKSTEYLMMMKPKFQI